MIVKDEEGVGGLEDILVDLEGNNVKPQRGLTFDQLLAGIIDVENEDTHY